MYIKNIGLKKYIYGIIEVESIGNRILVDIYKIYF